MLFTSTAIMNFILEFTRRWEKTRRGCWIPAAQSSFPMIYHQNTKGQQRRHHNEVVFQPCGEHFCLSRSLLFILSWLSGISSGCVTASTQNTLCTFTARLYEFIYPTVSDKLLTQVPFDFLCPLPWLYPYFGLDTFDLLVFFAQLDRRHIQEQQVQWFQLRGKQKTLVLAGVSLMILKARCVRSHFTAEDSIKWMRGDIKRWVTSCFQLWMWTSHSDTEHKRVREIGVKRVTDNDSKFSISLQARIFTRVKVVISNLWRGLLIFWSSPENCYLHIVMTLSLFMSRRRGLPEASEFVLMPLNCLVSFMPRLTLDSKVFSLVATYLGCTLIKWQTLSIVQPDSVYLSAECNL